MTTETDNAKKPSEEKLVLDPTKKRYSFVVPTTKNELVKEILKRWWYGMPEWPTTDPEYYTRKLKANNLRVVDHDRFLNDPEVVDGCRKVHPIESFRGIYLDSKVS